MHDEYHLYVAGPKLSINYVHLTEDMVEDLILLKDDICRIDTEYDDTSTRSYYDIDGMMKVEVTRDEMQLGSWGYEGFEPTMCGGWEEEVYVDTRIASNIDGRFDKYHPNTVERAFEIVNEEHYDEMLDVVDYYASEEYGTRDIEERISIRDDFYSYYQNEL